MSNCLAIFCPVKCEPTHSVLAVVLGRITYSEEDCLRFEIHPNRCTNLIVGVTTAGIGCLCVSLFASVDRYELNNKGELTYHKQYACRSVSGKLEGVRGARIITVYTRETSDTGTRTSVTYKIGITHAGGTYHLTKASDNVYLDAKEALVDAINGRVISNRLGESPAAAFLGPGGALEQLARISPQLVSPVMQSVGVMQQMHGMQQAGAMQHPAMMQAAMMQQAAMQQALMMQRPGMMMMPGAVMTPPMMYAPVGAPVVAPAAVSFSATLSSVLAGIEATQDTKTLMNALEGLKQLLSTAPAEELNDTARQRVLATCNAKSLTPVWNAEVSAFYGGILQLFGPATASVSPGVTEKEL